MYVCRASDRLVIRQVDISSTLAVLSGVPIPSGSVGVPVLSLLSAAVDDYSLFLLYKEEAYRLLQLLKAASLPTGVTMIIY